MRSIKAFLPLFTQPPFNDIISSRRGGPYGRPSWSVGGIAFFEYCLIVPANRHGFNTGFNGFQLKMIQEIITLVVLGVFAVLYLKEPLHWRYAVSFVLLLGAASFMFSQKPV